jgi:DNA modification methylase
MLEIDNIYQGDSLQVMKELPDNSIDLVLTDPPYNISQDGKSIKRSALRNTRYRKGSDIKLDFGEWDKLTDEDYEKLIYGLIAELKRVMKDGSWAYIFFDKRKLGLLEKLYKELDLKYRNILVWCKSNPVPSFRHVNWVSATEFISVFSKGDGKVKNWLYPQKEMFSYFITSTKASYGVSSHPTEKPIGICEKIIKINSNEGDLILDPFLGSGTTAVACVNLNRHYIGIELDQSYVEIARKRVAEAKMIKDSQLELFEKVAD